jgi:heptaprenyl diphosphate synthase
MRPQWTVKRITTLALLTAMAVVVAYAESFIPFWVPGVKPGLANIVILLILYCYTWYDALIVDLLRVVLASALRGTIFQMGFMMSLAGALLSLGVMILAKFCFKKLSIYGVSLLGAYVHGLAQILVAVAYLGTWGVFYYFPFISLLSLATGVVTALVAERVIHSGAIKKYT